MMHRGLLLPLAAALAIFCSPASASSPGAKIGPPHENGRFAEIEGRKFYVREWHAGPAQRGRILLIHGFGGSTYSWEKTAPALATAGWEVAAADIPGFGYSEKIPSGDYRLFEMARLLWILVQGISQEDWVIVGHSMGGDLAARMAALEPERTRLLVEVDGAVETEPGRKQTTPSLPDCPLIRAMASGFLALGARLKFAVGPLLASAYGRDVSGEELAGYMAPLAEPGTFSTLLYLADQRKDEAGALDDLLAYARGDGSGSPAGRGLIVWGGRDGWIPPSAGAALAGISGFRLALIPEAGHCPMETHPQAFLDIILGELEAR
jgi:pimeloyl-ACP methyl ester carboxylesterase